MAANTAIKYPCRLLFPSGSRDQAAPLWHKNLVLKVECIIYMHCHVTVSDMLKPYSSVFLKIHCRAYKNMHQAPVGPYTAV